MSLYNASSEGNISETKDLLTIKDVNVNEQGVLLIEGQTTTEIKGITPLLVAVWNNHIEIIKILLKRKDLEINQKANNTDGHTALMMASQFGRLEVVRLLLSKSEIDINNSMNTGATALLLATVGGFVK